MVVGYGHITPRTAGGRLATMLYAIVGIPLTLYTLTNLGFIMATAFRFLYKYVFCGLCCIVCTMTKPRDDDATDTADDDGAGTPGGGPPRRVAGTPGGPARRAVLFLRSRRGHRRRRARHVDVTESEAAADEDADRTGGWRERLAAVFAETVDINQVGIYSRTVPGPERW